MADEGNSCADLFEKDSEDEQAGWTESEDASVKKEGEGFAVATLIYMLLDVFSRASGRRIINPFYCKTQVWSKVKRKRVVCYPVASFFEYHKRIALVTGPIYRGAFPKLVHASSYVECVFSEKRGQMKVSNAILRNFLAAKMLNGGATVVIPSLMAADASAVMTTLQNTRRVKGYEDNIDMCRYTNPATGTRCDNR